VSQCKKDNQSAPVGRDSRHDRQLQTDEVTQTGSCCYGPRSGDHDESLRRYEAFYTLLLKRVGDMAAQGKSLEEIKKELKMPEYADWHDQERFGANIDAAYKSVKK
jgi:hypothetical protein